MVRVEGKVALAGLVVAAVLVFPDHRGVVLGPCKPALVGTAVLEVKEVMEESAATAERP